MSKSARVRAARKRAQEERLAMKSKNNYAKWYSEQPAQKAKAKDNAELAKAVQAVTNAEEELEVAKVTGENIEKAREDVVVAKMVVNKLKGSMSKHGSSSLSSGGDA